VILTLDKNSSNLNADSMQVEFRRIKYDVEASAKAIEKSLLPSKFADDLRAAK
jgi:hypothetical protein